MATECVPCLTAHPGGCVLCVRVVPNARKEGFDGLYGGALKVRLRAPPVEGKANAALLALLVERLNLPRSAVALLSGETSRDKRILLAGLSPGGAQERLGL